MGIYRTFSLGKNYSKKSSQKPFLSIIVVFKNEAQNLTELLPILLNQDYPNFEIILMDDFSSDLSANMVSNFSSNKIKYYHCSLDLLGKKSALKEAFSLAKGEYVLVTDADCRPHPKNWICTMIREVDSETDLILGYGPMIESTGFVNHFSRYETWHTALQYFSFALLKIPYMGVGRNMLIRKASVNLEKLYTESKSISGDDDLLVQSLANSSNTYISIDKDSFVYSESESSLSNFIKQKTRHVSSSWEYKWYHKLLLFFYGGSTGLLPVCVLILMFFFENYSAFWAFLCLLVLKWFIAIPAMKKLKEESLILSFPILDLTYSLYYWILLILMLIKPKKW